MEFKVFQKEIELQSRGWIPTFHDISTDVMKIVEESGVKNGTVAIVSHHTTCSVMVQECSHDFDTFDLEYLQHDLLDIMRKMIPDYTNEGDYRHPGPVHAQFGRYVDEPGNYTSMNSPPSSLPSLMVMVSLRPKKQERRWPSVFMEVKLPGSST